LVLGSWFLVLGSWFLVLGSWFLVLGSWFLVLGSWFLAGAWPMSEIMGKRRKKEFWKFMQMKSVSLRRIFGIHPCG
jgi:hypothetical protein